MASSDTLRIKKKKKEDRIASTPYNKLSGSEKSILRNGLKTSNNYSKELERLQRMYPGFRV